MTVAKHAARRSIWRQAASPEDGGGALLDRAGRSGPAHFGPHPAGADRVHARVGKLAGESSRQRVQRGLARSISTGRPLAESEKVVERRILQPADQRFWLS